MQLNGNQGSCNRWVASPREVCRHSKASTYNDRPDWTSQEAGLRGMEGLYGGASEGGLSD